MYWSLKAVGFCIYLWLSLLIIIVIRPILALYERKCQTPLYWDEVGERKLKDVELIESTSKKIKIILV